MISIAEFFEKLKNYLFSQKRYKFYYFDHDEGVMLSDYLYATSRRAAWKKLRSYPDSLTITHVKLVQFHPTQTERR